eukprot:SAG31_NODE_7142_length_1778_cov_4.270399_2_plen_190_part_00
MTVDWDLSPNVNASGFLRFAPVRELASLRVAPPRAQFEGMPEQEFSTVGAWGNALDIELNISFPNSADGTVPHQFGEVGVRILSSSISGNGNNGSVGDAFVEVLLNETWRLYTPGHIHLVATQSKSGGAVIGTGRQVVEAPWRLRPTALSMRVLVDRSIIGAYHALDPASFCRLVQLPVYYYAMQQHTV